MTVATRWQANEYRVMPDRPQGTTRETPFRNDPRIYQPVKIRVLRAFNGHKGGVLKPGTVLDYPKCWAVEAVAAHKAEFCE
jgi:hypothetical protein